MGLAETTGLTVLIECLLLLSIGHATHAQHFRPDIRNKIANLATYRYTTTTRVTYIPQDPDSYFFGFFPFWSFILVCLTCACLGVSALGILCWLGGLVNPRRKLYEEHQQMKRDRQSAAEIEKVHMVETDMEEAAGVVMIEQYYDDISVKVVNENNAVDRTTSSIFNESRVVSESKLMLDFDFETRAQIMAKKKKFRREHL